MTGWAKRWESVVRSLAAAAHGFLAAQFNLAWAYEHGRGVSRDAEQAAYWYRKAANSGDPRAQVALARLYYLGRGVPEDRVRARMWAGLAAAQGDHDGRRAVAFLDARLSADQIAAARRLALRRQVLADTEQGIDSAPLPDMLR